MRILSFLALVAIVGCSDRSAQSVDPRIADASRPLVFITNPTEPPTSYTNASGEVVGTDIDLARRIAAKMGRGLIVEKVMFPDILPRLKAGTADFGIALGGNIDRNRVPALRKAVIECVAVPAVIVGQGKHPL